MARRNATHEISNELKQPQILVLNTVVMIRVFDFVRVIYLNWTVFVYCKPAAYVRDTSRRIRVSKSAAFDYLLFYELY